MLQISEPRPAWELRAKSIRIEIQSLQLLLLQPCHCHPHHRSLMTASMGRRSLWLDRGRLSCRYSDPSTEGKVVFYDPTGKTLPTGQTWGDSTSLGDGRFRMDFAWGHKHP